MRLLANVLRKAQREIEFAQQWCGLRVFHIGQCDVEGKGTARESGAGVHST